MVISNRGIGLQTFITCSFLFCLFDASFGFIVSHTTRVNTTNAGKVC